MKFGLQTHHILQINAVFARYPEVTQAVLYGSRAKGNYKNGADIDLTLKGEQLNHAVMTNISNDLDELPMLYAFDLSRYDQIGNADLRDHIARVGQVFYEKKP